jgi:FtsH ternary system domain X7
VPPRQRRGRRAQTRAADAAARAADVQPRPPAGILEPLPGPVSAPARQPAPPGPRVQPASEPELLRVYARFAAASAALIFAGQLPDGQPVSALHCMRGGPADAWWVRSDLTLETARELVSVTCDQVYLQSGQELVRDRGWGDAGGTGEPVPLSDLRQVSALELVRAAGLHPCPRPPLDEAVVLLPGYLVSSVVRRCLDLRLGVAYRAVTLVPVFGSGPEARSCYEVRLRAGPDAVLPASVLDALDGDPFVVVCRRAADTLLMRHGLASPLPDRALASLTGDDTWVFADAGHGCARLVPLGEPQDGASLVRRGSDHELVDVSPEAWADPAGAPTEPAPPELRVVRARMNGTKVDAALLDDDDLRCLPALLAGEPLAASAVLIRGRDRHLLTAPGGLLEQLPVGEPLYCIGPGSLYLQFGYRLRPHLPSAARKAMFPTDASTGVVLLPDAALQYDLTTRTPVWKLWAGPTPPVDYQLPGPAAADVQALDRELTPAEPAARPTRLPQPSGLRRILGQGGRQRDWREEAYDAELAGDYEKAAEIFIRHNDPLRAARLYERAAER